MFEKLRNWYDDWQTEQLHRAVEVYCGGIPPLKRPSEFDKMQDDLKMVDMLYKLDVEKTSAMKDFNDKALELGCISSQDHRNELLKILEQERIDMQKAVDENIKILDKASGRIVE